MKDFAREIQKRIPSFIDYGDARVVNDTSENIVVKNGKPEDIRCAENLGFGVRVLLNGAWGFASSSKIEKDEIDKVIKEAISIAKASGVAKGKSVVLSPVERVINEYKTPVDEDPFKLSFEEKISLLMDIDSILRKNPDVKVSLAYLSFINTKKVFVSTDGSLISQDTLHSGGEYSATAVKNGEVQRRSYGDFGQGGYEIVRELKLLENAERVREEVKMLLLAKDCPAGKKDIVINDDQMVLQTHESIGHAVELDRVFGMEASYAGTSFVTTDKLNKFWYGSELVNVTADATTPGGLGTFGWDDEGIPAQRTPIIRDGIFVGYLSSRETAPLINRTSSGAMRADGWSRIPIIRMTNINLEPGDFTLEELIGGINDGLFLTTNKSWSIDDKRLNFQFGVEFAREIKNGKLRDVVRNVTYTGITPEFWGKCDGIGNKSTWKLHGIMNCGKGEPGQSMRVGHGVPPARFRGVQVGVFQR